VFPIVLHAQVKPVFPVKAVSDSAVRDTTVSPAGTKQIDITDVARKIFHPKRPPKSKPDDSLIIKPAFSALPAIGYTLTTKTAATISGNMAFRTDPKAKQSTVTASAAYTQNKQFTVPIESNIWTKNGTYNLLGDYRYYKYPQYTFGLGSNSPIENQELLDYNFIRLAEVVQHEIIPNFFAGLGYIMEVQWKIVDHPLPNGKVSDFEKYDTSAKELASGFIVNAVYDNRDNPINPSKGLYAGIQFRSNLKALGSQQNWQSLIIDTRTYLTFPAYSRNVLAFWSYDWLIIGGKPPYLDLPSTTWDVYSNTGRGYIQGRFRGSKMVYLESEYRIALTANGLLGMVVFANAESLSAAPGTPLQSIQPGVGAGLRIKLNKKSKTNLAIDYGFGTQGSNGLFINIAEAF
jgi:Omp85 superfamily domain